MERPVGRKITSVNPLEGALSALSFMKDQALGMDTSGRDRGAMREELDGIVIDTCIPSDTNVWETGINRESVEGKWVIVSQYESDEEAEKGHKQWVELMKEEPGCELKDIDNWNLGELDVESKEGD